MSDLHSEISQESDVFVPSILANPDFQLTGEVITFCGGLLASYSTARILSVAPNFLLRNPRVDRLYPPATKHVSLKVKKLLNLLFLGVGIGVIGGEVSSIEALPSLKADISKAMQEVYLQVASQME